MMATEGICAQAFFLFRRQQIRRPSPSLFFFVSLQPTTQAMRPIVPCPANLKMPQVMPRKLTQSDVIKKLMSAPDDEIVTFVFRSVGVFPPIVSSRILMKIRAPKSMLMKISPVFEAMFSANWDTNSVEMKDDVKFNQFDKFQLFLEVLLGSTSLSR